MSIRRYACNSPRKPGSVPAATQGLAKRLPLVLICLFCALFLRVPAAATLENLYVGAKAPDFSLQDLKGRSWTFDDFKDEKLTMVIFWSTWSRNSAKALADAQKLYSHYKKKGLAVVAVNTDSQRITPAEMTAITSTAGKLGLEYPVLLDRGLTVFHDFGVIALPSTVILDPARTVRYELSGYTLDGSDEMTDFIVGQIEGREPKAVVQRQGYQPDRKALRFYNMGKNALHSKQSAAIAELWFEKAAAADARFVQPHISLGKFYLAQGALPKAKEQFDLVLQKEPDNVVALCELGLLLVRDDKAAEGRALMEKGMQTEENYTPCLYYLGYAYGKEGKIDKALTMFKRALDINRTDMDIFVYQGRMFEEAGRPAEAARAYRQALALVVAPESGQ